jgi:hypothetical protein
VLHEERASCSNHPQSRLASLPDIHHALEDRRARGVAIEEYDDPYPVTTEGIADMGHSWAAWFIDPGQNVLAVVQAKGLTWNGGRSLRPARRIRHDQRNSAARHPDDSGRVARCANACLLRKYPVRGNGRRLKRTSNGSGMSTAT